MCCRYYVEPTEYFIELGEIASYYSSKSKIGKQNVGSVKHAGEITPGLVVPVLTFSRSGKQIPFQMYWGMTSKNGALIVNARTETAAEKPMFKESWAEHRCIVPASWYFEWEHFKQPDGSSKTGEKYSIQPSGMDRTFLCGLYRFENGFPHFSVLTRPPGEDITFIHDRMPLIMPEDLIGDWIDPKNDAAQVAEHALTDMVYERIERDDPQVRMLF